MEFSQLARADAEKKFILAQNVIGEIILGMVLENILIADMLQKIQRIAQKL